MELLLGQRMRDIQLGGRAISLEKRYPIDDNGHFVFIGKVGTDNLKIEIHKGCGRTAVQQCTLPRISRGYGNQPDGTILTRPLQIELDPRRQIFPLAKYIGELIERGISSHSICIMHEDEALDVSTVMSDPEMVSNGRIDHHDCSPSDARQKYTVTDANWAVLFNRARVNRLFLWPGAKRDAHGLLAALR